MSFWREAAISGAGLVLGTVVLVVAIFVALVVYSAAFNPADEAPAFLRTPSPAPPSAGANAPRPAATTELRTEVPQATVDHAPSATAAATITPVATPLPLPQPPTTTTAPQSSS